MCDLDVRSTCLAHTNGHFGVASFVSSAGCESEIFPHVYSRVTYYMDWISENTGIPIEP